VFPEVMPKRGYRKCLHCYNSFDSSSAAERVCPKCRRKHNKLLEKHSGVITIESTPQMAAHLTLIANIDDSKAATSISAEDITAFLDGDDIDDSAVYEVIKRKKRYKRTTAKAPVKTESLAVSFLMSMLEEERHAKEEREKKAGRSAR